MNSFFGPFASARLLEMYRSSTMTDVVLRVGDDTTGQRRDFHVHRIILAARCDYFEQAYRLNMQEAQIALFTFPGHHPDDFATFLDLLYGAARGPPPQRWATHFATIYVYGDYFGARELRQLALDGLARVRTSFVPSDAGVRDFFAAAPRIFNETLAVDEPPRAALLAIVRQHAYELVVRDPSGAAATALHASPRLLEGFARALLTCPQVPFVVKRALHAQMVRLAESLAELPPPPLVAQPAPALWAGAYRDVLAAYGRIVGRAVAAAAEEGGSARR